MLHGRPPDGSARAGRRAPSDPSHAAVHGPRLWPAIVLQQGPTGGPSSLWIGVSIEVDEQNKLIILSPPEKLVTEVTLRLKTWEAMVSLKSLKSTTGKLSWIAGIIPRCRWAVSILYGVIADHERDVASGAEARRSAAREDPSR